MATLATVAHAHDEVPGAPQQRPIALVGGVVHTVEGMTLTGATVLFDAGKIVAVGVDIPLPTEAERINVAGKHVYPGLFEAGSPLGLVEIDAVRATVDFAETGSLNPNVRAAAAVNPDSELIPVTRSNGVLLAVSRPEGGLLSGRGAVMQLDGWTWEEMTLRADVGMYVEWPRVGPADSDRPTVDGAIRRLEEAFADARAYRVAREADSDLPRDIRWDALAPVLDGVMPLVAIADGVSEIESAVAFADRQQVRLIVHGGYDAPHCAALLRERQIPVVVSSVHRLPRRRSDAYDTPFTLPERLRQAGVTYCIAGGGKFGASNLRNLPYDAATAAAHGLSDEEALRAITLYPARIFGVADRVGSLAPGKDATLFVADGDILDIPTHVERAWIQGRVVSLNDRHQRLWRKYEQKYQRE